MVVQLFTHAKPQSSQRKTIRWICSKPLRLAPLRETFSVPTYPAKGFVDLELLFCLFPILYLFLFLSYY